MQLAGRMARTGRFPEVVDELGDGVVRLRAHHRRDVPAMVEQCRDPLMVAYTTVPSPYEPVHAHQFLDQSIIPGWLDPAGTRAWAIESVDDAGVARFAGSIDYRRQGADVAEVGFGLHPWARGRGLMSRALRLVMQYAFAHGIETMRWRAVVGNWASLRTAWACGFVLEGTVRGLLTNQRSSADGWIATLRAGDPMRPRTRWFVPPVLQDGVVRLRPWREHDRIEPTDPHTARYLVGSEPPSEPGPFAAWLHERRMRMALGESVQWCLADAVTDQPLGHLQLFRMNQPSTAGNAYLAYLLARGMRGRGLMARAVELAVGQAFTAVDNGGLGLARLAAYVDADNRSSQRVLRGAGFTECGHEHEIEARDQTGGAAAAGSVRGDLLTFELLAATDRDAARVRPRPVPTLHTARLVLREWQPEDVPANEPDALADAGLPPNAMPGPQDFPTWLARQRGGRDRADSITWCIAEPESATALGTVVLFRLRPAAAPYQGEIGYWLFPHGRGHGYVREAVQATLAYALRPVAEGGLGLRRVHACANADNIASRRVLQDAGLVQWGNDHATLWSLQRPPADGAYYELVPGRHAGHAERRAPLDAIEIEGQRVRLRAWRAGDGAFLAVAFQDEAVRELVTDAPGAAPPDPAAWLADGREESLGGRELRWCIAGLSSDAPLGGLQVGEVGPPFYSRAALVECWVGRDQRGHGLAQEALDLALGHLLAEPAEGGLGLERVNARCDELNLAAQVVLRRAGFSREAVQYGAHPRADGTVGAAVVYVVKAGQDRVVVAASAEVQGLDPVELRGPGIRLRRWRESDVERLAQACSDPVTQYWLDLPTPYERGDALAYVGFVERAHLSGAGVYWCIADARDDRALGAVAVMELTNGDHGSGEIGYWLHPEARGRGVISAALRLVVRHALLPTQDGGLGLRRLSLHAAAGNQASLRVAAQAGFVRTGVDRRAERLGDGSYVDLVRHDLLAHDYLAAGDGRAPVNGT